MQVLMLVYRHTGDKKYLAPIPPALAYLKKSLLSDGRLARFYEMQTNKPLYFTKEYVLTYDDSDMPTHYGFQTGSKLAKIERGYEKLLKAPADRLVPRPKKQPLSKKVVKQTSRIIAALDDRGAWVNDGSLRYQKYEGPIIEMSTAAQNLNSLADYLAAMRTSE
jgi:hypothetical protein